MSHRVVHLVPYDGVGGVETAVRSLPEGKHGDIEFYKCFLAQRNGDRDGDFCYHGPRISENHPLNYLSAAKYLWRLKPELIICSLWRSCIVLMLFKLLRPWTKTVVFLHSPRAVHLVDEVCNRIAMSFATEIWVDSQATLTARAPNGFRGRKRVISFVTTQEPTPRPEGRDVAPTFIFWGRLHKQKGLDRALRLFAGLSAKLTDARYTIIGPDGGDEQRLKALCRTLQIEHRVHFAGQRNMEEIRAFATGQAFYLQTSEVEGMAMAVVEAMQFGLLPIVAPAGEIAHYCRDGHNSIIIGNDDATAISRIVNLVQDQEAFSRLSNAASEQWRKYPSYQDSVLDACRALFWNAA